MKTGQIVYPKNTGFTPKELVFTGTVDELGYYLFKSSTGFNYALKESDFNLTPCHNKTRL